MKQGKSIRTRYILVILAIVLLLLIFGSYICFRSYSLAYEDHVSGAMSDFETGFEALSSFQGRMNHLATIVQYNSSLVDMLSEAKDYTVDEYRRTRRDLIPMMFSMMDGSGDYICRIYVNSSLDLMDKSSHILLLDDIQQEAWAREVLDGWGWWSLYSGAYVHDDKPVFLAPIRNLQRTQELVALLRIDIDPQALASLVYPTQSSEYASVVLADSQGEVVSKAGLAQTDHLLPEVNTLDAYRLNILHEGKDTLYYRMLEGSDWQMCMTVDHARLRALLLPRYLYFVGMSILLVILGMLAVMPILGSMLKRIRRFHSYVENQQELTVAHLTPDPLEAGYQDEIGQLIEAHNRMIARIRELVEMRDTQEKELSRLEIQALQAQIKPHFLYNSLDAVIWMATLNEPEQVASTLRNLTAFYRLCLSRGSDTLPLEKELDICRHYFAVANVRYHSAFEMEIDVDEAALSVELPKITLQPLVENALVHGLMESERSDGRIRIYTRKQGALFALVIADTGAHFSRDRWERMIRGEGHTEEISGEGYGLRNVERRLCLFFGKDSVLAMEDGKAEETRLVLPLYPGGAQVR
ncbi:MAG: sensor histidine kinase [Clostridia bacterium]|nr:sensor histidine kinase [Clostridia bacterium]